MFLGELQSHCYKYHQIPVIILLISGEKSDNQMLIDIILNHHTRTLLCDTSSSSGDSWDIIDTKTVTHFEILEYLKHLRPSHMLPPKASFMVISIEVLTAFRTQRVMWNWFPSKYQGRVKKSLTNSSHGRGDVITLSMHLLDAYYVSLS